MLIKGKNLYLLVLASLFFLTFANLSFAKEKRPENVISTKSASVDYKLTWPGILPDQPLYKLKVLRDKIISKLIFDPIKKIE